VPRKHQPGFRFAPSGLRVFHIHNVKQPSFFIPGAFLPPGSSPSSSLLRRCRPPSEGIGGAPRDVQPCRCRAVTRDATLARHGPSRATGRYASRRSAVALSAQVPPPSRCRVRREGSTPPAAMDWLRCRAFRVRGYQPRSTPHPAPPSGSPRESAPHERDVHVLPQHPRRSQRYIHHVFVIAISG
jgi:hypothetical protein